MLKILGVSVFDGASVSGQTAEKRGCHHHMSMKQIIAKIHKFGVMGEKMTIQKPG